MACSSGASKPPRGLQKRQLFILVSLEASRIDFGRLLDLLGLDFGPFLDTMFAPKLTAKPVCHWSCAIISPTSILQSGARWRKLRRTRILGKTLPPRPPLSHSSRPSPHMGSLPWSWGSSANPKIVNRQSFIWVGVLPPLKSG